MSRKARLPGALSPVRIAALAILPLASAIFALAMGRMSVPIGDVARALVGGDVDRQVHIVVTTIRLPRVLLALLTGAGLSAAGVTYQSLFSNPLATPDTLGVASGASFGAALGILLGFGFVGVQLMALSFGTAAVLLTGAAGLKSGRGSATVVLSGIMVGSLFSALVSLIKYVADTETQLPAITYWLMGSLSGAGYRSLALGAPPILLGLLILFLIRWRLNVLPLSDDEARATGVHIRALRVTAIACATAITASCVSMCGQVGWVGLIIPHMCRMAFGNNHLSTIPTSMLVGAAFMVLVDTLARSATAAEIPISILTSIIGAPFFIYLMRCKGGWRL